MYLSSFDERKKDNNVQNLETKKTEHVLKAIK